MQSIKFISLIVLCATSSMALFLPAIGVVPFPRHLSGNPSQNGMRSDAAMSSNAWEQQNMQGAGMGMDPARSQFDQPPLDPWGNPLTQQQNGMGTMPGMPVSTTNSPALASALTHPDLGPQQIQDGTMTTSGATTYDSVGFGIWLLLVPVWLGALAVWSITPTSTRRSK
ncbi:hypothetical protein SH449x_001034 [Pirellulaceae bacterium SH449]